jgi:hypothetical protein
MNGFGSFLSGKKKGSDSGKQLRRKKLVFLLSCDKEEWMREN